MVKSLGESSYLFVYGTLRKYEKNHHYLGNAELVAEQAHIHGRIFDTGWGFPVVTLDGDKNVYGELYRVDENILKQVDELEGFQEGGKQDDKSSEGFERVEVTVHTHFGEFRADVYQYLEVPERSLLLELGDWRCRQELIEEVKYYYAFGSCMDDERFIKQGVEQLFQDVVGCGVLNGYEMKFSLKSRKDGLGRADIVETPGQVVEGKLYRIEREAIDYLYVREGVYTGNYRPALVTVQCEGRSLSNVLTFIVINKQEEEVTPPEWYMEEILRGAKGCVSDEYYKRLLEKKQLLGLKTSDA